MAGEVQLDDVPAALLDVARRTVPVWMRRVALEACAASGVDPAVIGPELDHVVAGAADDAADDLATLLATDVDEQRTTPLSVLRDATAPVVALLREHGVEPTTSDASAGVPPDHPLGPVTWADVDEELHEPGLAWGAWKAMTVLRRRRDEGLR